MKIDLSGRVALVTGGGRGIGRAIALSLAEAGADVAVNYRRDADAAEETVKEIEAHGPQGQGLPRLGRELGRGLRRWSPTCSRTSARSASWSTTPASPAAARRSPTPIRPRWSGWCASTRSGRTISPSWCCRSMRGEGRGDIIMISSVATLGMGARGAPYNMGKAAMEALALTLAKEEREHGIRTNIVAPSLTVTEMGKRLTRATTGIEDIHELDARSPFGRVSTPEDVAAVVTWLVSSANPYANGQKININGGRLADPTLLTRHRRAPVPATHAHDGAQ